MSKSRSKAHSQQQAGMPSYTNHYTRSVQQLQSVVEERLQQVGWAMQGQGSHLRHVVPVLTSTRCHTTRPACMHQ